VGVALAATWNPELIFRVGQVLGEETKTKGAHILLGPTVNIHRSPLAGRNFECFSEDPYLTGQIAVAYIKGVQSQGVGACIKHFVCNDSEFERTSISSEVAERPLREIYLEPFRVAIKEAKPWAVMSAYNKINGIYASENSYTLLDILKGEWEFDGIVISDWFGTYSENAANGGLDLEMPGPGKWMVFEKLQKEILNGNLKIDGIDDKIRRLLLTYERAGLFDNPEFQAEQAINKREHREIALEAASEGIVLLKNEDNLLPISKEMAKSIAVIGSSAKYPQIMGGGSSRVTPHYAISSLESIEKYAGDSITIRYAMGCPIHRNLPPIDINWLMIADSKVKGLQAEIFDNLTLEGKAVREFRVDRPRITWSDDLLSPANPSKFSVRLNGIFTPPKSGDYSFSIEGNGISRLLIDEALVVDNWHELPEGVPYWSSGQNTGRHSLVKDQPYSFTIEISSNHPSPWRSLIIGCLPPLPDNLIGEAVQIAKESDITILFAGTTNEWESEGHDRENMDLPGDQDKLIESVVAANPNTVVVLNTGAPITMDWIDKVPSVLQIWFGGQEVGNAVSAVLFGEINPSGKLPTTFPKRLEDNPAYINYPGENGKVYYGEGIFIGYRYYDRKDIEPLFPFGHGLSYTSFEYKNLRLNMEEFGPEDDIHIFLDVTNNGDTAGKETIQVYLRDIQSTLIRPDKELKAFRKVSLDPGESKTVTLSLSKEALSFYDPASMSFKSEVGDFEILVGSSSRDIRLKSKFSWKGDHLNALIGDSQSPIELPLKVLLYQEKSKQVLEKHLGVLISHPTFDRAIEMNLVKIATFMPAFLTEEKLKAINQELIDIIKN
jgi:beta-glucosidase